MTAAFDLNLLPARAALLGYLRRRVDSDAVAEDLLQDALLRALRAAPALRDEARLVPWFYRILENAVTDHYRRRGVRQAVLDPDADASDAAALAPEEEAVLCACFRALLPTLTPAYAEVIDALDLRAEAASAVADRLGISRGALKVRHHRARRQLRDRLETTCRSCARHGCLDCTCHPLPSDPHGDDR